MTTIFFAILCLAGFAQSTCYNGYSDNCPANPNPDRRDNPFNYHPATCNLKWKDCVSTTSKGVQQKPPPYKLCTSTHDPSGQVPTDWYTFSVQPALSGSGYTLHGLWPGSQFGSGPNDQPYGCKNGEEFDETYLDTFSDLFNTFWPTDPKYNNTMECFILSEWMKHGTCAVIPGLDGDAFRISQEVYYRSAMVLLNEYNVNPDFREDLGSLEPNIGVSCVQCAYFSAVGWTGTDPASVPRMLSACIDQCFDCTSSSCAPANLDSTVLYDPSNAPQIHTKKASLAAEASMLNGDKFPTDLDGNIWRSFGAEQLGSGKYEFAQYFSANKDKFISTTDSPYAQECTGLETYVDPLNPVTEHVAMHNCGKDKHSEYCLVKHLPDIGGLEVAFFACNHSGAPSPVDFSAAMDTPGCGNFLMFRCKQSAVDCSFSPVTPPAAETVQPTVTLEPHCQLPSSNLGIAGVPTVLLGSWRTLEVSQNYDVGLSRWNFTTGLATQEWPNYPSRGTKIYHVSHSTDGFMYLNDIENNNLKTCIFDFRYNYIYSYAVVACGRDNGPAPASLLDGFKQPNTQWAMGRCNGCSSFCYYSCEWQNDNCGHGSCDPSKRPAKHHKKKVSPVLDNNTATDSQHTPPTKAQWALPNWCKPGDSCWPTVPEIKQLEQQLGPNDDRSALKWLGFSQPQPAPVPPQSLNNQSFYGLGYNDLKGVKALYYYENIDDLNTPCYTGNNPLAWNFVSDMCKAAIHQNEYRYWNPYIVVFPLNERHVESALNFAVKHRLCISVAGTGHEYVSRNSCPTGGILIRTILFKSKSFMTKWDEDPSIAPYGAFKFGAGATFSEMHSFSSYNNRLVASGWCSTVGMVGYHLGGGHGPFAPSVGLGVDNLLEIEVMQIGYDVHKRVVVYKRTATRKYNPTLFWAMRGGGGGVWGVILSMTVRAHPIPAAGISRVYMSQSGTFCRDYSRFGYEWLRQMWGNFANWNLMLNQKVSTQPGFFIDTTNFRRSGVCGVTWNFSFEYIYSGGQNEADYIQFRDKLKDVLQVTTVQETHFNTAYEYVLTMPADKFALGVTNPLPPPHPPSDAATGSQNSVFVSRYAMQTAFPATMMKVLDICVQSLYYPDATSPSPDGSRCGFHYLYTSVTGNQGSQQPQDTAISPGFRSALMLWNARTLSTQQMADTLYQIGENSYFSESSYVMHDWTSHYWGETNYQQLLSIKKAHDPGNYFWCHHCIGDNPDDAYGQLNPNKSTPEKNCGEDCLHCAEAC